MKIGTSLPLAWGLTDPVRAAVASGSPRAKTVLLVWLWGAPSHLDTFDPKPDAPAEYRGPFFDDRHADTGSSLYRLVAKARGAKRSVYASPLARLVTVRTSRRGNGGVDGLSRKAGSDAAQLWRDCGETSRTEGRFTSIRFGGTRYHSRLKLNCRGLRRRHAGKSV